MASTIQLKTGTGSAVPSSLTQGEVGINIDNGLIYYGSGSGNDVKQLESFTNITASGDVSASGDVIGDIGKFSKIEVDGELALNTADSATTGQLFSDSQITKITYGKFPATQNLFRGTITASGDISSSLASTGSFGSIQTQGNIFADDGNVIGFNGGSRGTFAGSRIVISSGFTGIAGEITINSGSTGIAVFDGGAVGGGKIGLGDDAVSDSKVTVHGDFKTTSHITASGNISSSSEIIADNANFDGTIQVGLGGTNTDGIRINNGSYLTNINGLRLQPTTQDPTQPTTPHVTVGVGGHITASGNISSSKNVYANRFGDNLEIIDNGNVTTLAIDSAGQAVNSAFNLAIDGTTKISINKDSVATQFSGDTVFNSSMTATSITASGDISSSLASTGSLGRVESTTIETTNIKASLSTGQDNSVVILDSDGFLKTDEVDPKIFSIVIGPTGGGNLGSGNDNKFMIIDDGDSNTVDGGNLKNTTSPAGVEVLGNVSASGTSNFVFKNRLFDTGSNYLGSNGGAMGDVVAFGGTTTTAGHLYVLSPNGTWANTNASGSNLSTGSLAVALGTNSTTHGMLLRGMVNLSINPGAGLGAPVFLSTTTNGSQAVAPSSSGDFVRIIGHQFSTDLVYFNPSPDFIKIS